MAELVYPPPAVKRTPPARPLRRLVAQRLLLGLLTLFGVSILIFAVTQVLPGNAVTSVLGRSVSPTRIAQLESQLRLNESVLSQYWYWLSGVLSGHLRNSIVDHQPVWQYTRPRLVNTSILMLISGVAATIIGIAGGVIAALRRDRFYDHATSGLALVVTALPEFVVGIAFVIVFATVVFNVLPAVSLIPPGSYAWDYPRLLVLPCATLTVVAIPYIFRMTRGSMIEALDSEYVEMAVLKGLSHRRIAFVHALTNSIPAVVQVVALVFLYLAGGVVLVESVFSYPGVGQELVQAVTYRDIPIIQFLVLMLAAFYVLVNIGADVVALAATPRRRHPRVVR
jgi:peptide/nickel transport system permease protein